MYCNNCGKEIPNDVYLCGYCGTRVGSAPALPRKKLMRSRVDRKIAGVCGGMAEYFDVDPTLVRVLWLIITLFTGGLGLIAYILAWIIIPEEPEPAAIAPATTVQPYSGS
jgi:phage shock protein C